MIKQLPSKGYWYSFQCFNVPELKKNKKINNKNIDLKVETHNIKLFNNYINRTLRYEIKQRLIFLDLIVIFCFDKH
ncbi:hypothetical protein pb186bvf_003653 [Paramecium bursaria]